eukprot:GHVS01073911.1.p1 GENE.GHVS01073911.1~~GHVS01073911.1.p1  ORF type:complete len:277 (-),score=17.37 GHVS01073911.1:169-999(-)
MPWVIVPLDTESIDVSVDEDGTTFSVVLRGVDGTKGPIERRHNRKTNWDSRVSTSLLPRVLTSPSGFNGVYFTAANGAITSIIELEQKDMRFVVGPPNEYIKDIVAARDNLISAGVYLIDLLVSVDAITAEGREAAPTEWTKERPFSYLHIPDPSSKGLLISRRSDMTTIIQGDRDISLEELLPLHKTILHDIDSYAMVVFEALIDKSVLIRGRRYTVTMPQDNEEGIFILKSTLANIIIKRAYYTQGTHRTMAFIFNDGEEANSKGFACRICGVY